MARAYVTLDGYVVKRTTDKAIGIAKAIKDPLAARMAARTELAWLPRSCMHDSDQVDEGDTGLIVREDMADEKGLDYA